MKRVVWTGPALDDLLYLRAYIEKDNPTAAKTTALRVVGLAEALAAHPGRGRPGRIDGTRELVVATTPFIVPYRVRGETIEILRVLHGAMKWPEKL